MITPLQRLIEKCRRQQQQKPGQLEMPDYELEIFDEILPAMSFDEAVSAGVQGYTMSPDGEITVRPLEREDWDTTVKPPTRWASRREVLEQWFRETVA